MEPIRIEADRILDPPRPASKTFRYVVIALFGLALIAAAAIGYLGFIGYDFDALLGAPTQSQRFASLFKRYGPIPERFIDDVVYINLAKLQKDPCDWEAMQALGNQLIKTEKRLAANYYLNFSKSCQTGGYAERQAAVIFYDLRNFEQARTLFADLTERFPYGDLDWYHKGQSEHALGRTDEALESFSNVISLTRDPTKLGEWVFTEMSEIYASAGRFCDAMMPISTYIYLDPGARDTPRARDMLKRFSEKGKCTSYATGSDSFPILNSGLISVRAKINDIEGNFVVDTGAAFVTVGQDFADRAGLITKGSQRLFTASGETEGKMSKAAVRLGKLRAEDVPVAVLAQPPGKVDGLLGRSFLSRFDMTITKSTLTLKTK